VFLFTPLIFKFTIDFEVNAYDYGYSIFIAETYDSEEIRR